MNQEYRISIGENTPVANLTLVVSDIEYECNRTIAINSSSLIFEKLSSKNASKKLILDFNDDFHQFYLISNLFMGESILFTKENISFLIEISQFLKFSDLVTKSIEFQEYLDDLSEVIENDEKIQELIELESQIFSLSKSSIENVIEIIESISNTKSVCQLIINACLSRPKIIPLYLELIEKVHGMYSKSENDDENELKFFVDTFVSALLDPYVEECKRLNEYIGLRKEVEFILRWLLDHELIKFDDIWKDDLKFYSFYLIDYLVEKKSNIIEIMSEIYKTNYNSFFNNIDELKKNDWEIHKKLVAKGVNNYDIAIAIQNDDKDRLQQIVAQPNYSNVQLCKAKIPCSAYERCTFITESPTLIQYAAFFGSIECFKFLIMNDTKFAPNNFQVMPKLPIENPNQNQNQNQIQNQVFKSNSK